RNEDGSVGHIPDSLIRTFKTKGGREVKDGGGIIPDKTVPTETMSRFTSELYVQNMIFDYATEYYWSHPIPSSLEGFSLTDEDIGSFHEFLERKNFSFTTDSEEALAQVVMLTKREGLYENNRTLLEKLMEGFSHNPDNDIKTQKNDVKELIESELVGRYFYDAGAVKYSLPFDKQVTEAAAVASDKGLYSSFLRVGGNLQ
ncbi:MAG: hypothetical protein IH593_13235, partial [Bacteroidales bacterium]|nr:hypothetical protein [Bacteroidales bacterium]